MNDSVFTSISNTINTISLHQTRCNEFKKELDFFNERWPVISKEIGTISPELFLSALRRLGDEVMFLTIDTFSLHKGIAGKHSLLSNAIRDKGTLLSKVDKTDSISTDTFTHLGVFSSTGRRDASIEEISSSIKTANKESLKNRKQLKNEGGIRSKSHVDIDNWMNSILDDVDIKKLKDLRDGFAHNLDQLEKIENGEAFYNSSSIGEMLNVIDGILKSYKESLNKILTYTCSTYCDGIISRYDSLSRLKSFYMYESSSVNKI